MVPSDAEEVLGKEVQLTQPDYEVFIPEHWKGSSDDGHNQHFLVFDGPDGSLMVVWTQGSAAEGAHQRHRIVFSRSDDEGATWTEPSHVIGPNGRNDPALMAHWQFPLVSKSGRIYVIVNRETGVYGWIKMHTGKMQGLYSDDNGASWSQPQDIPMPTSPYDDPEGKIPPEWIVWQIPTRDLSGGHFVGYTHWINRAVATRKEVEQWPEIDSVAEFMRFENVDDDPEPRDLRIRYSAWGDQALRVPHKKYPLVSVAQEPSIVRLPDDRLFVVMRTASGYIWYSVSADDGETWRSPRPLLHRDHGLPLLQPTSACPIYQLADGRYVLFYHNNCGGPVAGGESDSQPRRPVFVALGEFRPGADQPLWFSDPKFLMDNKGSVKFEGDVNAYGEPRTPDLSMYSSFTTRGGNNVLWYPVGKTFLLGKKITDEFLADLEVPAQ